MGIINLPAYTDYWNNDLRIPNVANIMSLKRYQQIRRYLHFVDNNEDDGDRYFKIRLLLDMVREFFLKYEEGQKFSIDEIMIPYKGKKAGSRKQYMKMKPSKWGFKMFARAGISGYICDFLLYGVDDTFRQCNFTDAERSLGLGAMVVLALCKSIHNKPGSTVFFDNFFTSFEAPPPCCARTSRRADWPGRPPSRDHALSPRWPPSKSSSKVSTWACENLALQ
ncbi:hypothetical protein ABMA27_008951 [Loxostege sticticalis]|uniref:PiggyBac transposable element-derived protein domain-containing protein n=1 Tax=Loxostege sticticalis TaxID=481309 RepID=A0ABR3H9C7_LOXSC